MASDDSTSRFAPAATVLLVGVSDDIAARCEQVLSTQAITPLRVAHTQAAAERLLTTRSLVMVVRDKPRGDALAMLLDRALATASQVLFLDDLGDLEKLELHLKAAIQAARRSRSGSMT